MDHKDFAAMQKLYEAIEKDKAQRQIAEVRGIQREPNGSLSVVVNIVESMLNDEGSFKRALAAALQETIEKIASTIINDRRAEIEDACNFGELRDVLAAELARQFMASRLTGQTTPFDSPMKSGIGTASSAGVSYGHPQIIASIKKVLNTL